MMMWTHGLFGSTLTVVLAHSLMPSSRPFLERREKRRMCGMTLQDLNKTIYFLC